MSKKLGVAVIGYGGAFNMGRKHLEEMAAAGMVPTAACDMDKDRLKIAESDFPGIETYTSIATMLRKSDVQLVTIITPHNLHAKQTIQCLKAGRHVVVEKPFAITTAECDAMIAAAGKHKVMLSTYHNRHWDGCILQAVKTIRSGVIGDVVRVEAHMGRWGKPGDWWRSSRSVSGGILYDWGVHLMEYTLQIIDADIVEVTGFARSGVWTSKKWGPDLNEDEGFLVVRYANGAWSSLNITQVDSNPKPSRLEITGTKGTYLMNHNDYEIITHRRDGATVRTAGANMPGRQETYYQNVADHLTRGAKLVITPQWARRPVHIIDLGVRSAKKGRALPAKYK